MPAPVSATRSSRQSPSAPAPPPALPPPARSPPSAPPQPSIRAVTVTSGGTGLCAAPAMAASTALSIRLPSTVIRSRAESPGGSTPSSIRLSSVRLNSTPRSAAWAALPSSSAANTGSLTAATTRSVSCWASSSSAVANSTACSWRPSSISETTACSRLAASCACAPSASVKPRTESNSPLSACSSVWSRRVTTRPRPVPMVDVLSTTTRSAVRCTSSRTGSRPSTAATSASGRPRSATARPSTSPARPSSSRAASLHSTTRYERSSRISPSRTECSVAWWYSWRWLSSSGPMP